MNLACKRWIFPLAAMLFAAMSGAWRSIAPPRTDLPRAANRPQSQQDSEGWNRNRSAGREARPGDAAGGRAEAISISRKPPRKLCRMACASSSSAITASRPWRRAL